MAVWLSEPAPPVPQRWDWCSLILFGSLTPTCGIVAGSSRSFLQSFYSLKKKKIARSTERQSKLNNAPLSLPGSRVQMETLNLTLIGSQRLWIQYMAISCKLKNIVHSLKCGFVPIGKVIHSTDQLRYNKRTQRDRRRTRQTDSVAAAKRAKVANGSKKKRGRRWRRRTDGRWRAALLPLVSGPDSCSCWTEPVVL